MYSTICILKNVCTVCTGGTAHRVGTVDMNTVKPRFIFVLYLLSPYKLFFCYPESTKLQNYSKPGKPGKRKPISTVHVNNF